MKIIKSKLINPGDIFIVIDSKNKYQIISKDIKGNNIIYIYQKMKNDSELHPYKFECTEEHMKNLIRMEIIEFI